MINTLAKRSIYYYDNVRRIFMKLLLHVDMNCTFCIYRPLHQILVLKEHTAKLIPSHNINKNLKTGYGILA